MLGISPDQARSSAGIYHHPGGRPLGFVHAHQSHDLLIVDKEQDDEGGARMRPTAVPRAARGPVTDRLPAAARGACQCDSVGMSGCTRSEAGGRGSTTATKGLWGGVYWRASLRFRTCLSRDAVIYRGCRLAQVFSRTTSGGSPRGGRFQPDDVWRQPTGGAAPYAFPRQSVAALPSVPVSSAAERPATLA